MSRVIQFKRGTSLQNSRYTGEDGEIVIITDDGYSIRLHDGVTVGGHKVGNLEWGQILGTISNQTDLWNALIGKVGEDDLTDIDFGYIGDSLSAGTRNFRTKVHNLLLKVKELRELNEELNDIISDNNLVAYLKTSDYQAELNEAMSALPD